MMPASFMRETIVGLFVIIGLLCVAYLTVRLGRMEVFCPDLESKVLEPSTEFLASI